MKTFRAAGTFNESERPRVLVWCDAFLDPDEFAWVRSRAGTLRVIADLSDVALDEWDVVVTDFAYAQIVVDPMRGLLREHWARLPPHLFVFRIFRATPLGRESQYFDFNVDDGLADLDRALKYQHDVAGHHVKAVAGLPEPIQRLVTEHLVPATAQRAKQFGVRAGVVALEPEILNLRPFLYGPGETILAASYDRQAGGSVWLVPEDVGDKGAWFDTALVEWHMRDPKRFPNVTTWQTNGTWDTAEERAARACLAKVDEDFAVVRERYVADRAAALAALDEANMAAASGPKVLLTGQDEPLQAAVLAALIALGFSVEDMDEVWERRERREDFRISDSDEATFFVVADATGVTKGAPGSKISAVLGYAAKCAIERSLAELPGVWIIVNQFLHRDPETRGDLFRSDDLEVLVENNGLAIDTAALFVLSQHIEPGTDRARQCRAWLRKARGQVRLADAREWLGENSSA